MATSTLPPVHADSVDQSGVSIATTTASFDNSRLGSVYDPLNWAAAAPVWFHPTFDGRFVMVAARRWCNATPHGGQPGAWVDYTEDRSPSWTILDGPTGARQAVPNDPVDIPSTIPVTSSTVVAAASRPPNYLYLLNAVVQDGTAPGAVLQHFMLNPAGSITLANEELLPTVHGVVFDKGLQYDTPYLVVYGTNPDGQLHRIRKPWGRVGVNKQMGSASTQHTNVVGNQVGWEYWTGTGYVTSPTDAAPLTVNGGTSWFTQGPMSFASYAEMVFVTTLIIEADLTASAQMWMSRSGRPFAPVGGRIPVGSLADDSYLGGTVQLQPQLAANTATLDPGVLAGIPYCITTQPAEDTLKTAWDIWSVAKTPLVLPLPPPSKVALRTPLLHGHGQLTADTFAYITLDVELPGHGELTGAAWEIVTVEQTQLAAHGQLSATVYPYIHEPADLDADGQLTATAYAKLPVTGELTGHGELSALAWRLAAVDGSFPAHGELSAEVFAREMVDVHPYGHGQLSAWTFLKETGTGALVGHGQLTAMAYARMEVVAQLYAHGELSAAKQVSGELTGHGQLSAIAQVPAFGELTGHGQLSATVLPSYSRPATLIGVGRLSALGIRKVAVAVGLPAHGQLSGSAVALFTPFNEENINNYTKAIPPGASGVYVTLIGGGGAGASAAGLTNGGGGGGGGGRINRTWIPVASLGSTYSCERGGSSVSPGTQGGPSWFTSAAISLTANGGGGGAASGGAAGTGGTCTVSGITATSFTGGAGGSASTPIAPNTTSNQPAGGGAGGSTVGPSGKGGDSSTVTGGAGGANSQPGVTPGAATGSNSGAGGGGGGGGGGLGVGADGAVGGTWGGGGGGGGGANRDPRGTGGLGAPGYTLLEWV